MKHRSIGVFILLAATLAAAPQASQELAAIKNCLVGRVRAEFLQAFLNVRAGVGAKRQAPRPAQLAQASCDTSKEIAARREPNGKSARRDAAPRQQTEAAPRTEDRDEAAMIIDPNSPTPVPAAIAAVGLKLDNVLLGKAAGLLEEKITASDLAMIIQPTDDITPRVADARRPSARAKRNSEASTWTQYVAAPAGKGGPEFMLTNEAMRRELDEAVRAAAEVRVSSDVEHVKVLKLRRTGRFVAGPAPKAPQARTAPAPLWPEADERHFIPAGE